MRRRQQAPRPSVQSRNLEDDFHSKQKGQHPRMSPLFALISAGIALFFVCSALGWLRVWETPSFHHSSLPNNNTHIPPLRGKSGTNSDTSQLTESDSTNQQERQRRVIAIGDIHGDKDALVRALQLAKVVDAQDPMVWIGGNDIVVQIGDLLNKAEQRDIDTLLYISNIEEKSRAAGGSIVVTVGDHDLHNVPKIWKDIVSPNKPFPTWMHVVYIVDKTLFVHGSLSEAAIGRAGSIKDMNDQAEAWLSGKGAKPNWIGRGDGPVWSRLYSDKGSDEHPQCEQLSRLLVNDLALKRIIVGHTVRREGISSICNGEVWRIDVGLSKTESRAGKILASEVLELSNNGEVVTVLKTDVKLKSWT